MSRIQIQLLARTDVGSVRTNNEDNFIVSASIENEEWVIPDSTFEVPDAGAAFIVADGMGGEAAGEVASELAVQGIKWTLTNKLNSNSSEKEILDTLNEALVGAHKLILDYADNNMESFGMGTTATICYVTKGQLFISWVGDSRVYRFSKSGRLTTHNYYYNNTEILTNDHSVVWNEVLKGKMTPEQARVAPNSNYITQSLGDLNRTPIPEHRVFKLYQDDIILSCSDGLNAMLSDDQIDQVMQDNYDSLESMLDKFISEANAKGGKDNITVSLCKVVSGPTFVMDENLSLTSEIEDVSYKSNARYVYLLLFSLASLALLYFLKPILFDKENIDNDTVVVVNDSYKPLYDHDSNTSIDDVEVTSKVEKLEKKPSQSSKSTAKNIDSKANKNKRKVTNKIIESSKVNDKQIDNTLSKIDTSKGKIVDNNDSSVVKRYIANEKEFMVLLDTIRLLLNSESQEVLDRDRQQFQKFEAECTNDIQISDSLEVATMRRILVRMKLNLKDKLKEK